MSGPCLRGFEVGSFSECFSPFRYCPEKGCGRTELDDQAEDDKKIKWCETCHRIVGIGCMCGKSFKERIKHVAIDTSWMPNAGSIGGTMGD